MKNSIKGAIFISLVVQGAGSFVPLLTVVALARIAGPDIQGVFSTSKTWSDLVCSFIIFGFPQAFVYLINKRLSTQSHLLNVSILYATASAFIVVPIAAISIKSGYNILPDERNIWIYSFLLTGGIWSIVVNKLVRAIYLTIDDGFVFSIITSAPAFFLLATMVAAVEHGGFDYDIAFFVSGILTCLATGIWMKRIIADDPKYEFKVSSIPKRALTEQSVHAFLQSISVTLQPVLTIYLIRAHGGNIIDIAFFSTSTIVLVSVNVLFGLISPILFNRWSKNIDLSVFYTILKFDYILSFSFLFIGLLSTILYQYIVPFVFGENYGASVPAFVIISFAMAPVAFTRVIYPAVHAAGRPQDNTASCAIRLSSSIALQLILSLGGMPPLISAVWAWVLAEWLAAIYSTIAANRMHRWVIE